MSNNTFHSIYVNGLGVELGSQVPVAQAVADGRYDAGEAAQDGYTAVSVVDDHACPADLAVRAGRLAVDESGLATDDFGHILHCSVCFQGLDHWAPAPYIQSQTVGGTASAMEVRQASNGVLAATEVACGLIAGGSRPVLITASDVYREPEFDRFRSDKGLVRADGAAAMVLSANPRNALFRLRSAMTMGDATYEGMYRGSAGWAGHHGERGFPVDLRVRKREYFAESGVAPRDVVEMQERRMEECIHAGLEAAGIGADAVEKFVFAHSGDTLVDWERRKSSFGITVDRTTWEWGRGIGHMGSADQIAGLHHLVTSGELRTGALVMLIGIGTGFTFGSVVLEALPAAAAVRAAA